MAINTYFADELAYLREFGAEFAASHPKLSRYLAEGSRDPDVERLLEGFAFLTARLRQKLDDELPELSHSLISLLWPHYLRPVPALTIIEFFSQANAISARSHIPRGTTLRSRPVDGTVCQFQTCYDLDLYPLDIRLVEVQRSTTGSRLAVSIAVQEGAGLGAMRLQRLRLHFHGEPHIAQTLYLWICRYLRRVSVRLDDGTEIPLPGPVSPVGFAPKEGLLPYPPNVFSGYRLLQEYFVLPEKFLFVDIPGLEILANYDSSRQFDLLFEFTRQLDPGLRVGSRHVRLHCTPAVNLFPHDADPIRLDHRRIEYRVRPSGRDYAHRGVYSVDRVEGWFGTGQGRRVYVPFESFDHQTQAGQSADAAYYRLRARSDAPGERGLDWYISFVTAGDLRALPPSETISLSLTCSNNHLPSRLAAGQIDVSDEETPSFARFRNLTIPTATLAPPMDGSLLWHLISNMALNYLSLASPEPLRVLLSAYDFKAHYDVQAERAARHRLEGIAGIRSRPLDLMHGGLPLRGLRTELTLDEGRFAGEGDLYLFSSVLNEFFALYASINSFHELEVKTLGLGEIHTWTPRIGLQPIL